MIILSGYDDPALMSEARQAGACGYLVKGCSVSELIEAIDQAAADRAGTAAAGRAWPIAPPSAGSMADTSVMAPAGPPREARLTRWRLGLLAGASLLAPAIQVVQHVRHQHTEDLVVAVGSMVLFGLVLARLHGMAGEVAALAGLRKRLLDRGTTITTTLGNPEP